MKTMRRIVRDRHWSGVIAVSMAYLIMLQGLAAAMAQGAMAAAGAGPQYVICTAKGLVTVDPAPGGDIPGSKPPPWHCAALCQLASTAAPAVLGAKLGFVHLPPQRAVAAWVPPDDVLPSHAPGLIAEARAPPSSM